MELQLLDRMHPYLEWAGPFKSYRYKKHIR